MQLIKRTLLLLLIFLPALAFAKFLTVDQAFQLHVAMPQAAQLQVDFNVAPKHYLYRDRLHINSNATGPFTLPATDKIRHDGNKYLPAYAHDFSFLIPITDQQLASFDLAITYQGCAESGLCYPPVTKHFKITPSKMSVSNLDVAPRGLSTPSLLHTFGNVLGFFVLGLLLAFTPCVLPMLPILSSIITNHGENITTGKAFRLSLTYVLTMAFTYALIGLVFALLGARLQAVLQTPWAIGLSCVVLVGLALSLFDVYELRLPRRLQFGINTLSEQQAKGSYWGVAMMGMLATLVVSPCVSAPLVAALGYISQSGNTGLGALTLFSLGLGMGFPLLIIGTSFGKWLPRAGSWMQTVKAFFGVLLLAMAIWLLQRIIHDALMLALWGTLSIGCGVYLGATDSVTHGWAKLWKSLGLVLLTYGIILIIGASLGNHRLTRPLAGLNRIAHAAPSNEARLNFMPVNSRNDWQQVLAKKQWTFVDIYADWCTTCRQIENDVFTDPHIIKALTAWQRVRIDMTHMNPELKALLDNFNAIAPPVLILYNQQNQQVKRFAGEISSEQLLKAILKANKQSTT